MSHNILLLKLGGLLSGIYVGLKRHNWTSVRVLCCETEGAASFEAAKLAGKPIKLQKISTIASTLGALEVTSATLDDVITSVSVVMSDKQAVKACIDFANDQRILVEPACGASLAVIYDDNLRTKYLTSLNNHLNLLNSTSIVISMTETNKNPNKVRKVIVIVCGGSAISLDLLKQWSQEFELD